MTLAYVLISIVVVLEAVEAVLLIVLFRMQKQPKNTLAEAWQKMSKALKEYAENHKTNYNRIKNMNIDEMTEFLYNLQAKAVMYGYNNAKMLKEWLESEVTENE